VSEARALVDAAATFEVAVSEAQARKLLTLLDELAAWNQAYNLTSISERRALITHHLLDSLSVSADLVGTRIADVGTGAGFPGLPLALLNPERHFTLLDSNGKKIRFVAHAARVLGLTNVEPVQARAEAFAASAPFDTVVARAFAALPQLLESITGLCGAATRVLAMKGKYPAAEIAAIGSPWQLQSSRELSVPGLGAERCVLRLGAPGLGSRSPADAAALPAD
jgi:16S rRNA (guanine527-N7)-methyltransferase